MTPEFADAALTFALREQIALYRQVREALAVAAGQVREGLDANEALTRVNSGLKEARSVADRISTARRQLANAAATPGPESATLLREAANFLDQVSAALAELSQIADARKQAVAEELDTLNQADKMRQAYGAPPEKPA